MSKNLIAASAKPMILSLLGRRESYGYQILQDVTALSGGTIDWSEALLYPVLHRLEKEGLVRSRWKMSDEKRMRKYYALTPFGRRELEAERERWLRIHGAFLKLWAPTGETE
jgi:DNA-binding PadR family transcriptional regulator